MKSLLHITNGDSFTFVDVVVVNDEDVAVSDER